MLSSSEVLVGSYDYFLVGLSVLISIVASYAALDLAGRVTSTGGMRRLSWLGYGAVTMGLGIWSMHYVGMLAFRVPVPVLYDWPTVLLSLLAAILASGVALYVVSREKLGVALVIAGSLLMGGGIASMHYIGMAAMRLPAMCHYSTPIVSLSIALAVVISFVALLLAFRLREDKAAARGRKAISALAMGLAIPVMHYTGMAAATFTPAAVYQGTLTSAVNITTLGAAVLVIVTLSILSLTVLTSSFDRRFSRQATELQISESRSRLILEASLDAFVEINADETISSWNPQAQRTFGWTSAEAMGKSFPDLLLPAGRRGAYESNLGALSDASPGRPVNRRFETRACRRDAGEFPVEITLSSTGSVRSRHFGAFIRDLSQRERTDQKFSGLLNASSEAILFVNSRGEIVLANSQAAKLFGYSVAEMQKERIETLVPDRFREQHGGFQEGFFQHPRARRMGEGLELWGVRQDGSEFPTEISLAPVEAEEGTLACAVIVDITARKEREQALKNTHEKLAAVLAEAEFRAQEGTKLADLLDILQSCHTIEEAFQVVERYLPRILECPSGALALTNSSRNCVEVAARWNQMELSTELTFTPDQCWALRRGKPHSAGGGEPGPRCTHVRASDVSYICAPLAAQGETLGVLYLERIS